MKIDWSFVAFVLGFGFALGFIKPFIDPIFHLIVSLVAYGALWFIYKKKTRLAQSANASFYNFWTRLIIFYLVLRSFKFMLDAVPDPKGALTAAYVVFMVAGLIFCFSSNVRMYCNHYFENILSKISSRVNAKK